MKNISVTEHITCTNILIIIIDQLLAVTKFSEIQTDIVILYYFNIYAR